MFTRVLLVTTLAVLTVTAKKHRYCEPPRIPEGATIELLQGRLDKDKYAVGSFVSVICPKDFHEQGSTKRECLPTGFWSGETTRCETTYYRNLDDSFDTDNPEDDQFWSLNCRTPPCPSFKDVPKMPQDIPTGDKDGGKVDRVGGKLKVDGSAEGKSRGFQRKSRATGESNMRAEGSVEGATKDPSLTSGGFNTGRKGPGGPRVPGAFKMGREGPGEPRVSGGFKPGPRGRARDSRATGAKEGGGAGEL